MVPLILRVLLAVVMFPHGAQKVLGWFGGSGLPGSMSFLTGMGIPAAFAALAIAAEFLGGALSLDGLIAGTNARTFRSRAARV